MRIIPYPFLFILFLFSVSLSLFAQQNTVVDGLLEEEKATFEKSVYLILAASGQIDEEFSSAEALQLITPKEWHVKVKNPDDPIPLGTLAAIVMKAFDFKGGLLYTIFPGPRYALREIAFRGFVQGRVSPYMYVSGAEAATIVRKALVWKGEYR